MTTIRPQAQWWKVSLWWTVVFVASNLVMIWASSFERSSQIKWIMAIDAALVAALLHDLLDLRRSRLMLSDQELIYVDFRGRRRTVRRDEHTFIKVSRRNRIDFLIIQPPSGPPIRLGMRRWGLDNAARLSEVRRGLRVLN